MVDLAPLDFFASRACDLERISFLLRRSGFVIRASCSWPHFLGGLGTTSSILVAVPWLDADIPSSELRALVRQRPWSGNLLLTECDPENLRLVGRTGFSDVLFLRSEESRLPASIRQAHLGSFFFRVGDCIRGDHSLPPLLRDALLLALEQEPLAMPQAPGDSVRVVRSVRSLAHRLSQSEDHLGRTARENDLDLRDFLNWCVALRSLQLRWGGGEKWESIAWRFGYASVSGLSEHLKHTLGARPREIAGGELEGWFGEFERRFVTDIRSVRRNP